MSSNWIFLCLYRSWFPVRPVNGWNGVGVRARNVRFQSLSTRSSVAWTNSLRTKNGQLRHRFLQSPSGELQVTRLLRALIDLVTVALSMKCSLVRCFGSFGSFVWQIFFCLCWGCVLVVYRYQVLAVATDAKSKEESQNIKSGKKVAVSTNNCSITFMCIITIFSPKLRPTSKCWEQTASTRFLQHDWAFNIGEQALDVFVTTFSSAPVSIFVLGKSSPCDSVEVKVYLQFWLRKKWRLWQQVETSKQKFVQSWVWRTFIWHWHFSLQVNEIWFAWLNLESYALSRSTTTIQAVSHRMSQVKECAWSLTNSFKLNTTAAVSHEMELNTRCNIHFQFPREPSIVSSGPTQKLSWCIRTSLSNGQRNLHKRRFKWPSAISSVWLSSFRSRFRFKICQAPWAGCACGEQPTFQDHPNRTTGPLRRRAFAIQTFRFLAHAGIWAESLWAWTRRGTCSARTWGRSQRSSHPPPQSCERSTTTPRIARWRCYRNRSGPCNTRDVSRSIGLDFRVSNERNHHPRHFSVQAQAKKPKLGKQLPPSSRSLFS